MFGDGSAIPHSPIIINNSGRISSTMLSDANQYEAFLWEPGRGRTRLGTLGDKGSVATAMNNRGQIVGCSYDSAGHVWGFLWDEATDMTQLDTPHRPRCQAVSINDTGQILVMSIRQPLSSRRWFLLDPNGPISLDALPPDAWPYSINSGSCIVAIEKPGGPKPYMLLRERRRPPCRPPMRRVDSRHVPAAISLASTHG